MSKFYTVIAACILAATQSLLTFSFEKNPSPPEAYLHHATSLTEIDLQRHGKVARAVPSEPEIITNPEGEMVRYLQKGIQYYLLYGLIPFCQEYEKVPTVIVTDMTNGKIYIKNPLSGYPTDSYIVGTLAGNVATFEFPQTITFEKKDGEIHEYSVMCMEFVGGPDDFDEGTYVPSENQTVTYSLENGIWKMDNESDGTWILGLANSDGGWLGYGDYNVSYVNNNYEALSIPEGLSTETWQFISDYTGFEMQIGFDGNDVYLGGLCPELPDAWVKGRLENGKIVFEGWQYLGQIDELACMAFFVPGHTYIRDNGHKAYELADKVELVYNAEKQEITSDGCIVINTTPDKIKFLNFYTKPLIHPEPETHSLVPQNPVLVAYQPYTEEYSAGGLQFYLPNLTVDNYLIDKEKLFWQFYVDNDIYTFEPYLYACFTKDTTDVPFTVNSQDILNGGSPLHELHFFFDGAESFGILSKHNVSADEVLYSQMAVFTPSAVDNVDVDDLAPEIYYDMQGRRIANPDKGSIYIVKKGATTSKRIMR